MRSRYERTVVPLEALLKASPADIRKVCPMCPPAFRYSEPTILVSQTMPDEHPSTPPPIRWPALITLPHLANVQFVWRRLCDVVLFPRCLFAHVLPAVCVGFSLS